MRPIHLIASLETRLRALHGENAVAELYAQKGLPPRGTHMGIAPSKIAALSAALGEPEPVYTIASSVVPKARRQDADLEILHRPAPKPIQRVESAPAAPAPTPAPSSDVERRYVALQKQHSETKDPRARHEIWQQMKALHDVHWSEIFAKPKPVVTKSARELAIEDVQRRIENEKNAVEKWSLLLELKKLRTL